MSDTPASYAECVDAIESSYEFMLAYAAQGRDKEATGGDGMAIRPKVQALSSALEIVAVAAQEDVKPLGEAGSVFLAQVAGDAARAKAAVDLALAAPNISSQLVDNLNASAHLRMLLTDLFLLDEALKATRRKV